MLPTPERNQPYGSLMRYEPERTAAFFDDFGYREWARFEDGRTSPISIAVHTHSSRTRSPASTNVGAGPGRFTIELARLGATVTAADISQVQLELNRRTMQKAGLEDRIAAWTKADIIDMKAFTTASFDVTVCFGGPLSYVLDRADDAIDELLRVTRLGGHLLVGVMSLIGATASNLPGVIELVRRHGPETMQRIIATGDLPEGISSTAPMHLYRWSELAAMLRRHACEIVAGSASGISYGRVHRELHLSLTDDEREMLAALEVDLAAEGGAVDIGEHIIAVLRKTPIRGET